MRARRQYRAPTQAEIAALGAGAGSSSPSAPRRGAAAAVTARARARSCSSARAGRSASTRPMAGKALTVVAELSAASIQAGRWKDGADVEVVAVAADGSPAGERRGARIEPGAYAAAIRADGRRPPGRRASTVRLSGAVGESRRRLGPAARRRPARWSATPSPTAPPRASRRGRSRASSSRATNGSASSGRCSRRSTAARCVCSTGRGKPLPVELPRRRGSRHARGGGRDVPVGSGPRGLSDRAHRRCRYRAPRST